MWKTCDRDGCNNQTRKTICHPCSVKFSNRRMREQGKGALAPEHKRRHYVRRTAKMLREKELAPDPKRPVPIVDLDWWLNRPIP